MLCAYFKVLCLFLSFMLVYVAIVIEMFCAYLKLDMDINVVICCVELVAIVFKFCTCELLDMDTP